jgi:diguanylate cyclase (GGDEF)-like protein
MHPDGAAAPAAGDPAATWRATAALWPGLLAGCGQALAVKDAASGRYRAIGPGWQALFGLDPAACVGLTDGEIFGGAVAAAWRAADQMALDRAGTVASDHAFEWRGQWREFAVTRQGAGLEGEPSQHILSHWIDVRAQRQQARQLAEALSALQQAHDAADAARRGTAPGGEARDPVSGLPGREPFLEQLRREFDLSAREGREMSLVLLEVDPAPSPDPDGPVPSAEEVAREIGGWLRTGTRTMDATARLDATRYAILLSGAGLAIAARRAEALRASRRPVAGDVAAGEAGEAATGPAAWPLTVSMGVASYPLSAGSPEALLEAAGQALQRARARGGSQIALAGLSLQEQSAG